ncbi:MAG: amidase domain-containing protein [Blastocatellia bacterium]
MKQRLFCVPILLLLTVAVFFSTIIFLSQQTQADIQGQTGSYNRPGGFLPTGLPVSKLQANSTDQGLKERLTGSALAYLKAEHEVKLTGKRPTQPLVTRYDGEQNRERTEEERISAGLRLNQHYKESVRRLTDVEVALTPSALRVEKDKTLLQATEHTIYRYSVRPGVDLPDTSEDQVVHVFVFRNQLANPVGKQPSEPTLIRADYKSRNAKMTRATARRSQIHTECDPYGNCMVYDSTGCDPYGYYPCEDPSFDNSNYCCYAEEVQYLQPSGDQPIAPNSPTSNNPNACNYNGNDAGWYADIYAFSYNTSYRHFDNDCTNFVSQALAERGRFCYRGFKLKKLVPLVVQLIGESEQGSKSHLDSGSSTPLLREKHWQRLQHREHLRSFRR